MRKIYSSSAEALEGLLRDGVTLMVGGFGLCGVPQSLVRAVKDSGVKHLTCISNNAGVDDSGLGLLLQTRQIDKMIAARPGEMQSAFFADGGRHQLALPTDAQRQ